MINALYNLVRLRVLAAKADYQVGALATLCHRSPRQLRRQFQAVLGYSPQQWLDEQRLAKARQLLLSADCIKDVAYSLGFKQPSHFCRQFKLQNGITPSQFILRHPTVSE